MPDRNRYPLEWKQDGEYLHGWLAGYNLYTVCGDGKGAWLQGATLPLMSRKVSDIETAKRLAEENALEVVQAVIHMVAGR